MRLPLFNPTRPGGRRRDRSAGRACAAETLPLHASWAQRRRGSVRTL